MLDNDDGDILVQVHMYARIVLVLINLKVKQFWIRYLQHAIWRGVVETSWSEHQSLFNDRVEHRMLEQMQTSQYSLR